MLAESKRYGSAGATADLRKDWPHLELATATVALLGLTLQGLDIAKKAFLGLVLRQRFRINGLKRFRCGHEPVDHLWRDRVGPGRRMAAENVAVGAAPLARRALKQDRVPAICGRVLIAAADGPVDPERGVGLLSCSIEDGTRVARELLRQLHDSAKRLALRRDDARTLQLPV